MKPVYQDLTIVATRIKLLAHHRLSTSNAVRELQTTSSSKSMASIDSLVSCTLIF